MKKPKYKFGDFLFIVWRDAVSFDDWADVTEVDVAPPDVHSVGILVAMEDSHLTLAINHDTINDKASCFMSIPTGMIVSIKKLR